MTRQCNLESLFSVFVLSSKEMCVCVAGCDQQKYPFRRNHQIHRRFFTFLFVFSSIANVSFSRKFAFFASSWMSSNESLTYYVSIKSNFISIRLLLDNCFLLLSVRLPATHAQIADGKNDDQFVHSALSIALQSEMLGGCVYVFGKWHTKREMWTKKEKKNKQKQRNWRRFLVHFDVAVISYFIYNGHMPHLLHTDTHFFNSSLAVNVSGVCVCVCLWIGM